MLGLPQILYHVTLVVVSHFAAKRQELIASLTTFDQSHSTIHIIIIISNSSIRTAFFERHPSLDVSIPSCIRVLGFHFLGFRNSNLFFGLSSNSQPGGPGPPVTGWPSYTPRHWGSFSLPSVGHCYRLHTGAIRHVR
jgi:hypothetical protein